MALNPPLLPTGLPAGLIGEFFLLERDGIECSIEARGLPKQTLKGARLFVTTLRLCIVSPTATSAGLQCIDIPLQGISGEEFKQPIFVRRAAAAPARPPHPAPSHNPPGRQRASGHRCRRGGPRPGGPRRVPGLLFARRLRHFFTRVL